MRRYEDVGYRRVGEETGLTQDRVSNLLVSLISTKQINNKVGLQFCYLYLTNTASKFLPWFCFGDFGFLLLFVIRSFRYFWYRCSPHPKCITLMNIHFRSLRKNLKGVFIVT